MSTNSFNWKSLFINEESNGEKEMKEPQVHEKVQENKFPETTVNIPSGNLNNPFLNEILEIYQKGFDGLNNEGFDFFELYKSVNAVGVTNPQSYQMAFTMGKTINPNLSKDFLISKAAYYLQEIDKVHQKNNALGKTKHEDLTKKVLEDKTNLAKSISELEAKITDLQAQLTNKKQELDKIDLSNNQTFSEIQLKIEANNIAKQKIVDSINLVLNGVNQYL
jgi:hypothetical protein